MRFVWWRNDHNVFLFALKMELTSMWSSLLKWTDYTFRYPIFVLLHLVCLSTDPVNELFGPQTE